MSTSNKPNQRGRGYAYNGSSSSSGENYSTPQQEEEQQEEEYGDSQEDLNIVPGTVYWDPNSPSDVNSRRYQARLGNNGTRRRIEQTSPSILGSKVGVPPPPIPVKTCRSNGTPKKFTRTGSMEELKCNFKILIDKNQSFSPINEESKQKKTTTITTTTASAPTFSSTTTKDGDQSPPVAIVNPSCNVGSSNAVASSSQSQNVFGEFPDDDDDDIDYDLLESTQAQVEKEYLSNSKRASSGEETYYSAANSRVPSEDSEPGRLDTGSNSTSPFNNNDINDSNNNSNNTSLFEKSSCDDPIQSTPSRPKYPRLDSNGRINVRNSIGDNSAKPTNEVICVGELMDDDDDDAFLGNLDY